MSFTCFTVDCGIPFYFENGIVDTKEGTTFEHSAIYRCDAGYMIDYEASRTCLSSGEWSGPEPKCEPIGMS